MRTTSLQGIFVLFARDTVPYFGRVGQISFGLLVQGRHFLQTMRDVIEALLGQAKQRLEAKGRSELNKSILLLPCMCGELTHDLVAQALTTVRVQDVTTWVAEEVGETMLSVRRRELGRRQPQKPETQTADLFAHTG